MTYTVIAGVVVIIWAVLQASARFEIMKRGVQVGGRVVDTCPARYGQWVVVQFKHQKVRMEKKIWCRARGYRTGDAVRVGYWDQRPNRCILAERVWRDAAQEIALALALALVLAGAARWI